MDKHQILRECAQNLVLLTQLGLSIATPPIITLYAADWLRNRLDLGLWIMVLALILGVGGSISNVWKFVKWMSKRSGKPRE